MAIANPYLQGQSPEEDERLYPASDNKPMAETEVHRDEMIYSIEALRHRYAGRPDVQVSGNNFIYYEQGNPKKVSSPDCYVVFGVPKRVRKSYFVWREGGKFPDVVIEFTSESTRRADEVRKRLLYEREWGVSEYVLFDPLGDYLDPRLQGFRLHEGRYTPIPLTEGRLYSEQLALDLVMVGEHLRYFDPLANEWLRTYEEAEAERVAEKQRADAETAARFAAEAENARLRAELEALRRQAEP